MSKLYSKNLYKPHNNDDDLDYYLSEMNYNKLYEQIDDFFKIIIKGFALLFLGINLFIQILFSVVVIITLNFKALINFLIQIVFFLSLLFMTIVATK